MSGMKAEDKGKRTGVQTLRAPVLFPLPGACAGNQRVMLAHRESGQLECTSASGQQTGQSRIPGDQRSNNSQVATDHIPGGATAQCANSQGKEGQRQE